MKKQILLASLVLVAAVSFTSCKKDYTCECKDNTSGAVTSTSTITSRNKTLAKTACELFNTSGSTGQTCGIK